MIIQFEVELKHRSDPSPPERHLSGWVDEGIARGPFSPCTGVVDYSIFHPRCRARHIPAHACASRQAGLLASFRRETQPLSVSKTPLQGVSSYA